MVVSVLNSCFTLRVAYCGYGFWGAGKRLIGELMARL